MKTRAIWRICSILLLLCVAPLSRASEPGGDTAQKLFLWKVTGSPGVVYLFGTIHVGRADFYPLAPVIENRCRIGRVSVTPVSLFCQERLSRRPLPSSATICVRVRSVTLGDSSIRRIR